MLENVIKPALFALFVILVTVYSVQANAASFSKDYFYNVDVVSVYDGDTFKVATEIWPQHFIKTSIRMYGIDTPETTWRAKCTKEKALGIVARDYLRMMVNNAKNTKTPMTITNISKDKYAGRFLGNLFIGNVDVSKKMIELGYAVEYFGKGTKKDWCK